MVFTTTPTPVWSALEGIGARAGHLISRTPWREVAAVLAGLILVKSVWSTAGAGAALSWAAIGVLLMAVTVGRRHFPQTAGVVAASATSVLVLTASALIAMSVDGVVAVPFHLVLLAPMLVIVTAAVFVAPHRGVHVGWSVALSQGTILATIAPTLIWSDSSWVGVVGFSGFVAALAGVYFRSRHAAPVTGRWRRLARWIAGVLVAVTAALTMSLGSAGQAHGIFGIGDFFESKVNSTICSFTRPDLTGESVGTGPESMFPARNFGQVKGLPPNASANSVPANSDQAGNFDRLGPNNSLDNYTLFEISGLRGLKFVNWQKNATGEEVCSIMPWVSVTSGNMVMSLNTYLLQGVIMLKEISQSGRPFEFLYNRTIPLIDALFNYLFLPAAALMFTIAGIGMIFRGVGSGRGFREAIGEAGGVAAVLIFGGLFFGGLSAASWSNPGTSGFFILGSTIDQGASAINSAIAETSFTALELTGEGSMCKAPQPVPAAPGQDAAFTAAAPGQRFSSCILAEGLAYRPWALGQFGAAGNKPIAGSEKVTRFGDPRVGGDQNKVKAKDDAAGQGLPCYNNYGGCTDMRTYLISQEGGPSFEASRRKCMNSKDDFAHLVQCDPYHAVANQLTLREKSTKDGELNEAAGITRSYNGSGRFPHLTQALVALIATVITGIGISIVSVICLWWQFMLLVLFWTGVVRLLFAAFPGKASGAVEYAKDFGQAFVMRILYGLLSLFMIAGIVLIFGASMAMGLKLLFTGLLLFGLFRSVRKLEERFKVQGSTMTGPAQGLTRAATGATALAGYAAVRYGPSAAAGAARRTAGAAAAGGRGAKWAVTRPPAGGPPRPGGGGGGGGGGGSSLSPLGRAGRSVATGSVAGAAAAASAARGVGRGARVVASPMTPWAKDKADAVGQQVLRGARRADRALGARLAPARSVGGQATNTASSLIKDAGSWTADKSKAAADRIRREGAAAVSYTTPRMYEQHYSDDFKQRMDDAREGTTVGKWKRGSFSAAEEKHAAKAAARARAYNRRRK